MSSWADLAAGSGSETEPRIPLPPPSSLLGSSSKADVYVPPCDSSVEWRPPSSPYWQPFASAIRAVFGEWDILAEAVSGGWAGDARKSKAAQDKLVDDLLANYAERWALGKECPVSMVDDFLIGTMDDLFHADIEQNMCYPVAKLCCTLYDECRKGELNGANIVIERQNQNKAKAAEKIAERMKAVAIDDESANGDADAPAAKEQGQDQEQQQQAADDDGWTTVPARGSKANKGRRNKKSNNNNNSKRRNNNANKR